MGGMTSPGTVSLLEGPELSAAQLAALRRRAVARDVSVGEVLYRAGDRDYDFILTDRDLSAGDLSSAWTLLGRGPLPFETSLPGVFAVGDARVGSLKPAAAVGEGAGVIRSVHLALMPAA